MYKTLISLNYFFPFVATNFPSENENEIIRNIGKNIKATLSTDTFPSTIEFNAATISRL